MSAGLTNDPESNANRKSLMENLDSALRAVGIDDPADDSEVAVPISQLRRRRIRSLNDPTRVASLVDVDGVLYWEPGLVSKRSRLRRRAGRAAAGLPVGEVVRQVRFEELPASQVTSLLEKIDDKLTPKNSQTKQRGLLEWKKNELVPVSKPPASGKMLLFVHGTFSNSQNLFDSMRSTEAGQAFLKAAMAKERYPAGVFAIDHPTLATSPLENAVDLARLFQSSQVKVDVIAHSRGGLVTRWWCEALSDPTCRGKAVLLGSPLAGTSLASPPKWRSLMDYLTNLSTVIDTTVGALKYSSPLLTVSTGLLKIFGSFTSLLAKTPLADAAVALVPGLNGQSRVGNQPGLLRLRETISPMHDRYFSIVSDFEPEAIGWKFWRVFNRPLDRVMDFGADALFDGKNDLVVDCDSMGDLNNTLKIPKSRTLDFGTNSTVHHTNYFVQKGAIDQLAKWLF